MTAKFDPDNMPEWLSGLWPQALYQPLVLAGINDDDCAVIHWAHHKLLILTVDYLNASPIAVQLGIGTQEDLGRLVVASSISDLCGTGAKPEAMLMALTMERTASEEDFKTLMRGVQAETAKYNIPVIGGDTKLGASRAMLSVAIGSANSESNLFFKNAAEPGDLLWCSGPLGSCNAAAIGIARMDMSEPWREWAKRAILKPEPPVEKSARVASACMGKGGIDISDGLGADVHRLCSASGVGLTLFPERIPVAPEAADLAEKLHFEPWMFAFGGGGDFQFLVTTAPSHASEMNEFGFYQIGSLNSEKALTMIIGQESFPVPISGHRDAHELSFTDEIHELLKKALILRRGK